MTIVIIKEVKKNGRMKDRVVSTPADPRFCTEFFEGRPYRESSKKWGKKDFYRKDQLVRVISEAEFDKIQELKRSRKKGGANAQLSLERILAKAAGTP